MVTQSVLALYALPEWIHASVAMASLENYLELQQMLHLHHYGDCEAHNSMGEKVIYINQ